MERQKGSGCASYIYGRSVHNARIERLWLDWTQGVGLKWHDFFMSLEHNYDLKHDNPAHIWLLHYLFLDALNADAEDWATAWNNHVMQIAGETNRSPVDMFTFGILRDGAHGFTIDDARMAQQEADSAPMSQEEAATFGVDYEAHGDARLMAHLAENNHDDTAPMLSASPRSSPLSAAQIAVLDARLRACVDLTSWDMEVRKLVWCQALRICGEMFA
ncbi:hypothetical protein C8R44DRAFT_836340 [Mycena epipterygia]|nr:hypothetical protein C8R44DRAFT_836340 [Mycena epipterygia]